MGHFRYISNDLVPTLIMQERKVNEIGILALRRGRMGNGMKESRVFSRQLEIGQNILGKTFFRRKPWIIQISNDVFEIAHHIIQSISDKLFLGSKIIFYRSNINSGFLGNNPYSGGLESLFS